VSENQLTLTGYLKRATGSLQERDFRLFWTGETTSLVGTAVAEIVLPLVGIRVLHAGTFAIASLTAAAWLPWVLFGLFAGVWVDRLRKRPLMILCDLISLLLFASIAVADWLKLLTIAQLLIVAILAGVVSVFFKTAFQTYIPILLGRADLMDGNAKLQGSAAFAQVSGPGIGGAIAQFFGVATGVLLNAFSFAVSALCLFWINAPEPDARKPRSERRIGREIIEGLHFLRYDPYLRPLAFYTAVISLGVSGADSLMIVFLVRTVGVPASVVGVILALMGIGGLFGVAIATRLVRRYGSARAMLLCRLMLSSSLLLPLTTRGFALIASAGWIFVSAGIGAGNVISAAFRQARCPSHMRGRISASYYTLTYSCMALGGLFGGILGTLLGVRQALWIMAGILTLASSILFFSPIRRLHDLPEPIGS
jgi:predicted MFS family arabinose efflux permease